MYPNVIKLSMLMDGQSQYNYKCVLMYYTSECFCFSSACLPYSDIDECAEGTHQCEQNCHNNIGSYTCSCDIGYRLNVDLRGCDGTNVVIIS